MDSPDVDLAETTAYRHLASLIRARISDGTLRPGWPAASITSLSQEHGYARQTCSKALRLLEAEGLVTRIPGRGYYVCLHDGRRT
jgi:GntR family transcriptional regulator, histidine utilization repressor